ncbi:MAG TPA: phosphoenolpyruvate carboxykinase (ATP) [Actinomycetota bacterium]|nr:phosphoenolpyruvate carboxykinase (ATP) [Actinomycetota bacterium]
MSSDSLAGIDPTGTVHRNLSPEDLVERALARNEGVLARTGALVTTTGSRTGRSPKDRFFVAHGDSKSRIDWGSVNRPFEPETFDALLDKARGHLGRAEEVFVVDGFVGADPNHRINLRVITELAWHALFAHQLFRRPDPGELERFEAEFTLFSAPLMEADPSSDGTNSEAFVGLDLERKQVLICGTQYAGEMKKSIFTSANYLLPVQGVLPMHCSANVGEGGDVALFFGLSGTGKTTLSADPARRLIGDDEHGWSDQGVFNFEGGCYAKCIDLSEKNEPQIWNAIKSGAVVENVVVDGEGNVDYADASITENTRAAYPLEYIPNFIPEGRAGHAKTVVFLTADAFGVMPPIAKLTNDGAMYHFLSGFTAKLAGTEAGMGSEPEATFSTCFGAPFLPLPAGEYARMLGERIQGHDAEVFLVNTGWTGGPYGTGERMSLPHTRAMVKAATSGALKDVETRRHPIFNVDVPVSCPGVPDEVLDPRRTWADPAAYDEKARELALMFVKNFDRFAAQVPASVVEAGPRAD